MRRQIDAYRDVPVALFRPLCNVSTNCAHDTFKQDIGNSHFLAQRHKIRGWNHGTVRTNPACERLYAGQFTGFGGLLRLVIGSDLAGFDGTAQFRLQVELVASVVAHFQVVIGNRVVDAAYRTMQRRLGAAEYGLCITAVHRMPGYTESDFQEQVPTIDQERFLNRLLDSLGDVADVVLGVDAGHEQSKFVGSESADNGPLLAALFDEGAAEPIANRAQKLRARIVAHRLVDEAEAVDVEQDNHGIALSILCPGDQILELFDQQKLVGQTRDDVEIRNLLQCSSALFNASLEILVGQPERHIGMPLP